MPAKELRYDVSVVPEIEPTGEHAIECGAIALACAECRGSAGCHAHAVLCPVCGTAGQTTDGHLLKLAGAKQVLLATLDVGIPGAYLIPA